MTTRKRVKRIKTYVTRIRGAHTSFKTHNKTKRGALDTVWSMIRGGYQYGVTSRSDLTKKSNVNEV